MVSIDQERHDEKQTLLFLCRVFVLQSAPLVYGHDPTKILSRALKGIIRFSIVSFSNCATLVHLKSKISKKNLAKETGFQL
jgi:hypothetical protein